MFHPAAAVCVVIELLFQYHTYVSPSVRPGSSMKGKRGEGMAAELLSFASLTSLHLHPAMDTLSASQKFAQFLVAESGRSGWRMPPAERRASYDVRYGKTHNALKYHAACKRVYRPLNYSNSRLTYSKHFFFF